MGVVAVQGPGSRATRIMGGGVDEALRAETGRLSRRVCVTASNAVGVGGSGLARPGRVGGSECGAGDAEQRSWNKERECDDAASYLHPFSVRISGKPTLRNGPIGNRLGLKVVGACP
jgi:hypothetical protein